MGLAMALNAGCYEYRPLYGTTPVPGQDVALDLSDQGRAALGEQLGGGVLRVEGTLHEIQDGQYVVGVGHVTTVGGGSATWDGEQVKIPVADVSQVGLRSLSRTRTALIAGAAAVGVVLFIVTRSFSGSGNPTVPDSGTTPPFKT
jgi:hypothetical protein